MTVRGQKREREKTEIGLLVCCAVLCCEHVIRLQMSLVQTINLRLCGIVGICVVARVHGRLCAHNFGGLRKANHCGVC